MADSERRFGPGEVDMLVTSYPGLVRFGTASDAVSKDWIIKAEAALGLRLSESYKWFLRTYAGGEIGGEEIYSLYGLEFGTAIGGDVVYQHLNGLKNGATTDSRLVVSETDFAEVFFFDYERMTGDECPLLLQLSPTYVAHYADDFYEFLCKRIAAYTA